MKVLNVDDEVIFFGKEFIEWYFAHQRFFTFRVSEAKLTSDDYWLKHLLKTNEKGPQKTKPN